MTKYTVLLVDDEQPFISSLGRTLEEEGYPVLRFSTIRDVVNQVGERMRKSQEEVEAGDIDEDWFIAVLDHDFPREDPPVRVSLRGTERDLVSGYDIAEWLRLHHPLRWMLPIIYLSGRESAQGFIARMRENGQFHPDDFITKAEIGIDVDVLLSRIAHFDSELGRLYALIEEHGPERGRYIFFDNFYE
jgi:CheY-like chemotaxis protein